MHRNMRIVFSVSTLILIMVLGVRLSAGVWTPVNWLMLAIPALVCLLVFRCFVYIFNFSYALACLFNGLLIAVAGQSVAGYLLGGLMALYGLRLFWFTWIRTHSDSYATRMERIRNDHANTPVPVQAVLWLQCTVTYAFHLFAVYIAAERALLTNAVLAGAAIIFCGIVLEAVADAQKQAAKTVAPDAFVTSGLFARWRHPNFIGEIIVQIGLIVVGLSVAATWNTLLAVLVTPVYVFILMVYQCRQVDTNMQARYGEQPEFAEYFQRSGSLLPKF